MLREVGVKTWSSESLCSLHPDCSSSPSKGRASVPFSVYMGNMGQSAEQRGEGRGGRMEEGGPLWCVTVSTENSINHSFQRCSVLLSPFESPCYVLCPIGHTMFQI